MPSTSPTWLPDDRCERITLRKYASSGNSTVKSEAVITDPAQIKQATGWLQSLPTEGDKFIDFIPGVSFSTAEFTCANGTVTVEVYNDIIKTPATSFYGQNFPEQTALVGWMREHLAQHEQPGWLASTDCDRITLRRYDSMARKRVTREVTVTDPAQIAEAIGHLESLPLTGDMMIKPGPGTPYSTMTLRCGTGETEIEFFNHMLKTQSTGFYSEDMPAQTALVAWMDKHLSWWRRFF